MISGEGVFLTLQDKDGYLLVRNESQDVGTPSGDSRPVGQLSVNSSETWSTSCNFYADSHDRRYRFYSARLRADTGLLHNMGEGESRGMVFPGTVLSMRPKLEQEYQMMGVFWLPDGRPADVLNCEGESCLKVDKLDEGLFLVSLGGNGFYHLRSGNAFCVPERRPDTTRQFVRMTDVRCQQVMNSTARHYTQRWRCSGQHALRQTSAQPLPGQEGAVNR